MAIFLLALLLALIATALILPRVPAIRRIAGVEGIDTDGGEDRVEIPASVTLHPSLYPPLEAEEAVAAPSRVLTTNYRSWMLRPVARTADGFTGSSVPRRVEPVTVVRSEWPERNRGIFQHRPQGVSVLFPEEWEEGPDQEEASAVVGESCPVLPGFQAERMEELNLAISLGERRLVDQYSGEGDRDQLSGSAVKD